MLPLQARPSAAAAMLAADRTAFTVAEAAAQRLFTQPALNGTYQASAYKSAPGRNHLFAVDADSSHSTLLDGPLAEGPRANGELRMPSDGASSQSGRGRLRGAVAGTAIAGAPIAAATAWASQQKGHAECDQQERAEQVKHADQERGPEQAQERRVDDAFLSTRNSQASARSMASVAA
jgi:hypothetical protein